MSLRYIELLGELRIYPHVCPFAVLGAESGEICGKLSISFFRIRIVSFAQLQQDTWPGPDLFKLPKADLA
jgi:hypothetical protein